METVLLILLYYFAQKPDFLGSVQPLMSKLQDSQKLLDFLGDLSKFQDVFSFLKPSATSPTAEPSPQPEPTTKQSQSAQTAQKNPPSPVKGIADEFIQSKLDEYFSNRTR